MKILLSLFHHTLLYLYAKINQFIAWMNIANDMHVDQKLFEKYQDEVNKWNDIKSLEELCRYFQERNDYKPDGKQGLFHHYNSREEFFLEGYDCEDVAFMAQKKLRELGYKTQVIGIMGSKASSWHYDLIIIEKEFAEQFLGNNMIYRRVYYDKYYMLNYGKKIKGNSIQNCIDKLSTYKVNNEYVYPINKTIWWRCYW